MINNSYASEALAVKPIVSDKSQELAPDNFVFKEQKYRQDFILRSFLDAIFSTDIKNDIFRPIASNQFGVRAFYAPERLSLEYPWIYQHLYYPKDEPRFLAVNKWTKPIKISPRLPNKGKPFEVFLKDGVAPNDYEFIGIPHDGKYDALIKEEVEKFIPQLSELTNLPISYLEEEQETPQNHTNLSIVFLGDDKDDKPSFKSPTGSRLLTSFAGPRPILFTRQLDHYFTYANYFTNTSENHVEGYFLANEKNEIEYAFCYIQDDLEEHTVRSAVQECLIRSLGIPNFFSIANGSGALLSDWDYTTETPEFNAIDQLIISLLYRDEVKAGMSPLKIQEVLMGFQLDRESSSH